MEAAGAADGQIGAGLRRLELWSLDPLVVGALWWWVLPKAEWVGWAALPIWLAALWLGYVADRLLDVRMGGRAAASLRHRFYAANFGQLLLLWWVVLLAAAGSAVFYLEEPVLRWGWILAGAVVLYLLVVQWMGDGWGRILGKRLGVALLFSLGAGCMTGAWASEGGRWGLAVLALGALSNLLVISRAEARTAERHRGIGRAVQVVLVLLLAAAVGLWPVAPAAALAGCSGLLGFGWLVEAGRRELGWPVRLLADLALIDMAIAYGLVRWWF